MRKSLHQDRPPRHEKLCSYKQIRNVISDHVNINKPIIDCSYTVRAKTTQSPLLRCTLPLPLPHSLAVLSYKFYIPVTRFQRVSIFCY